MNLLVNIIVCTNFLFLSLAAYAGYKEFRRYISTMKYDNVDDESEEITPIK